MTEIQRVKLKKIYVWRATLFGLLFGLLLGIISSLIIIFLAFTIFKDATFFGQDVNGLLVGASITISILIILISSLSFAFTILIVSSFYNLLAKMGIKLHFLFEEHLEESNNEINYPKTSINPNFSRENFA